jgi:hypothetical protein
MEHWTFPKRIFVTGELDAVTREKLVARHDREHPPLPIEEDSDEVAAPSDGEAEPMDDVVIDPEEDEREMERFENMDEE